ncbi:hypothetical protein [Winogradskyella luteola]|uniref:Uncharacterized protein n=1 Tax=Winogradskyella luteola TaxID=2828330 RepID=A0A9X1F6R1_9FLAO|nr:hypothetical protein [Winogradskyella luteola]MBV7268395.1 hypothetical protein [Winogradskyella luteola]
MPKIIKQFELDVTPERFLNACSPEELYEVELLITSPRFTNKINQGQKQLDQ